MEEQLKEIKRLREVVRELDNRINNCRDYLMSTETDKIIVENVLTSLGFNKNGMEVYD